MILNISQNYHLKVIKTVRSVTDRQSDFEEKFYFSSREGGDLKQILRFETVMSISGCKSDGHAEYKYLFFTSREGCGLKQI